MNSMVRHLFFEQLDLGLSVMGESVDSDNTREPEVIAHVVHVALQIDNAFFEGLQVFLIESGLFRSSMVLKSADSCHEHDQGGAEARLAAFDIHKFLGPQVSTKP